MSTTALAQYQIPERVSAALPERMCNSCTTQIAPLTCSPIIEFDFFSGNSGGDQPRQLGHFVFNQFSEDWKTEYFTTDTFTNAYGKTVIGRDEAKSWVKYKISMSGWVEIEAWLQGASVQTSGENHFSGGAIEMRLRGYKNTLGGFTVVEMWSSPEGFRLSSFGSTLNYGSFAGLPSMQCWSNMSINAPAYGGYNRVVLNQILNDWDMLYYRPVEVGKPGTDVLFNFLPVKITFPGC